MIGVFTPTEASAFAAAYAIFLSCAVYRALSLRELYRVFANAVQLTGELLLIVSLSFALGWGLSNAHVPEVLARGIDALVIVDSQFLRVLSLVLLAILAGMILDPLIPVLLPIILPTLLAYQIDLVHFGVLMVIAVVIGQVTPPMAIALVISGRLADVDQLRVFGANWPFLWGMVGVPVADHAGAGARDLAAEHWCATSRPRPLATAFGHAYPADARGERAGPGGPLMAARQGRTASTRAGRAPPGCA